MKKTYVVVGLGRFGSAAAIRLCELGNEVLAIDNDPDLVQQVAPYVTQAVVADAQDAGVLRALGVRDFDCAIVAIERNLLFLSFYLAKTGEKAMFIGEQGKL